MFHHVFQIAFQFVPDPRKYRMTAAQHACITREIPGKSQKIMGNSRAENFSALFLILARELLLTD